MLSIGYLVGQLNNPIDELIEFIRAYQEALLSFERLHEIQVKPNENNSNKKSFPLKINDGFLLKKVSFKYPGSHNQFVINDISICIPHGKITAIVGTSGSGKSTLLKLLLGFYLPSTGKLYIDGIDLAVVNTDELRNHCGIVMQDGYIYNTSIAENIALADEFIELDRLYNALTIACLTEFVENLPLKHETKLGHAGIELSGGQKQSLFIARAVYKNPEIIMLDEATSSLDANNELKIIQNLQIFFVRKTVLIIAHRLSTVKNADQIIVLDNGRIVEVGNHNTLVAQKGKYFDLIRNQLELGN